MSEVRRTFRGALVSPQDIAGVLCERAWDGWQGCNSGAALLAQAAHWDVRRLVLLGYDCQFTYGRAHWHGDHPVSLGNARSIGRWAAQFESLKPLMAGIDVVNASRETALTIFPCMQLDEALS
jgi:hypothetical protein